MPRMQSGGVSKAKKNRTTPPVAKGGYLYKEDADRLAREALSDCGSQDNDENHRSPLFSPQRLRQLQRSSAAGAVAQSNGTGPATVPV